MSEYQLRLSHRHVIEIIKEHSNSYKRLYSKALDEVLNEHHIKTRKPRYIKAQLSKKGLELIINVTDRFIENDFSTDLGFIITMKVVNIHENHK